MIDATLELYSQFLSTIPDAALVVNREGEIAAANLPASELFGEGEKGLVTGRVEQLIPAPVRRIHRSHMQSFWENPVSRPMNKDQPLKALKLDGSAFPAAIMLTPLSLREGPFVLCIVRDLTEQQRQEELLRAALGREKELALTDPLTNVANVRRLRDRLKDEMERAGRHHRVFSLAYLDLDNFKAVNDNQGHAEGDRVLQRVARVLLERLRNSDLVARVGGDEFVLLLPETGSEAALTVIGEVLDRLKQEMQESQWPITFSCGTVTFRSPPAELETALEKADRLMYQAKRGGKDNSRFEVYEKHTSDRDNCSPAAIET